MFKTSPAWLSLCFAIGIEDQNVKRVTGSNIFEIVEGMHDMRVNKVAALVEHAYLSHEGMWSLVLADPSGSIVGFILATDVKVRTYVGWVGEYRWVGGLVNII